MIATEAERVSPFVAGDPIHAAADVRSIPAVLQAAGVPSAPRVAVLPLAPRVLLIHTVGDDTIRLRCVHLAHAPALLSPEAPVTLAFVLTAPLPASPRVLGLAGRLRACLADPRVVDAAAPAATREALVAVIDSAERAAGEAALAGDEVLALLDTRPGGLDAAQAQARLAEIGANRLERVARRPLALRFLGQFSSFFAVLLWIGAGLAWLAGLPELSWAILAVIVVNGTFAFLQEYRAERAVEALQQLLPHGVTTLRGGRELAVEATALVPGDVVHVEEGDQIAADGQLLDAQGLRVDQSALTGEAHPVFKLLAVGNARQSVPQLERHELLFAGTSVVAGSGTFVVTATGMATEIGGIAHLTQSIAAVASPLQREMTRVTRLVTILAVAFGVAFFTLGVLTHALTVPDGLTFAIGVIVANVPEGLLPTLTLALAWGVQRLARRGALMKRLSAVETLGAATVICTDKTGTLTRGVMETRRLWTSGGTAGLDALDAGTRPDLQELIEAATLASVATRERGDPTEIALVDAAVGAGIDVDALRAARPLLAPYPFDSFRKRMTLLRAVDAGGVAYVKGAPRETLALCTTMRRGTDTVLLTAERRDAILTDHDAMARQGLRLLAVAVRPHAPHAATADEIERELTFLGLVALWDPPRPEVAHAIAACHTAGIRVVMITGDYGLTAQAIAAAVGLRADKVVTGEELDRLPPETVRALAGERGVLFARTSPSHKYAIVAALRAGGEVVAVTGDGVNDAPALKAADIGVAMGRRGSDVAKEAAEMVITDDNFASIVDAIRQGRATYANMGKFVTYIFASNVPELVPFLAFVFLGIPLPLTIMQILAVDLGTDLLPALALGAEPPEPDVMQRPPRGPGEPLLGAGRLLRAYAFLGVAETALALLAFFWTYWQAGWRPGLALAADGALYRRATTMTLAGIVASQVGNVLACRTDRQSVFRIGLGSNPLVFAGIGAEIGLLLLLIGAPPLREVFGLAPPTLREWPVLLLFPPVMLLLEEARKALARRRSVTPPPAAPGRRAARRCS